MSTAGKVLTVLAVLMLVVSIVMISAVAQLNTNQTQALDKVKADVAQLKTDVAQAEDTAIKLRVRINEEQAAKARELRLVGIRLSTAERQLTTTKENLARVQNQVDNYTKALATAKAGLEARVQEKADLETQKAAGEALVKRLQGENDELLGQLTKLRTDFQEILKKNTDETEGLYKSGKPGGRPAARPASLSR
jgi:chromosome segregation ATPase